MQEQIPSMWELGGLSVRQLAIRVWDRANRDDVFGRAGQLAYSFFLSVFPLLLFMIAILGFLAASGTALRSQLFNMLSQALPPSAYHLTSKTLNDVINSTGRGKTLFGGLLFLWAATSGTTTMMSVLSAAYHVYDSRPWYKIRAIALGLTLCLCVLVFVALALMLFGGRLAEMIAARIGIGGVAMVGWKAAQWLVALLALSLAFSLLYYFGPDVKERRWYWITPGSLAGVFLWLLVVVGFRIYLHYFNTYSKTYGSLGTVIILLLWFYVTGLVFLLGGEINATIKDAAAERSRAKPKVPTEKKAA